MAEVKRRDFLGMALGGVTAVGAVASLIAVKKTWDPLPSVVSAGVTTVDVAVATLERCVRILHLDEVQDSGVEITVPKDSNCVRVDVTIRQFVDASEATGSSRLDTVSRAEACVDRIDGQIRGLLEALSRLDYAGVLGLPSFD